MPRELFKKWLRENTSLEETTIHSYVSALRAINNFGVEENILSQDIYEVSDVSSLDRLMEKLEILDSFKEENIKSNRTWSSALKQYRQFLLSSQDKGQVLNKENKPSLKEDFEKWLSQQVQADGKRYSKSTQEAYVYALERLANEMKGLTLENKDLFTITKADDFSKLEEEIRTNSDFEDFNSKLYEGQLAAGMKKYSEFLKERNSSKRPAWFVESIINDQDGTQRFIDQGIWENGYKDKYLEEVKSIQVGDRIAMKSAYVRIHDLPFDNRGNRVSVMGIKAIGLVTHNYGDGRRLSVEWQAVDPIREWYFFTGRRTIWRVAEEASWKHKSLIDFTFNNSKQDIDRFINDDAYSYQEEYEDFDEESSINEIFVGEDLYKEPYSKEDFLKEVFINEEKYETIKSLLLRKKNLILQGAPGVGKTYAAKRLVYSLMGEKDDSRVRMIQFHQSYSYEDFIMGYRPTGSGFELKEGSFYKFCQEASAHPEENYFFIIDEINRGNMSKIFGELMMLIEHDKRGEEVILTYSDQAFQVPKNLHLIGMMNTADRSLAIIDYALRRRFCFVELEPAFETESFKNHLLDKGASEDLINKIKMKIGNINLEIEKDVNLGRGFRIGHSYFCDYINSDSWYEEIIRYEIYPLIKEYWFDEEEKAKNYFEELLK